MICEIVSSDKIDALAAAAPADASRSPRQKRGKSSNFDLDAFVARHLPDAEGPTPWNGGERIWTLPQSPMCEHHDGQVFVGELPNGAITAGCHHNSCSWNWHDLRSKFEPDHSVTANGAAADANAQPPPEPVPIGKLIQDHPQLSEPVIDGILRRGETANIIAPPKVGKSWLAYDLLLAVAIGGTWLRRFPCRRGRVLLIDNELHPMTIAHRIPMVATALQISEAGYSDNFDVLHLRGRLLDLAGIGRAIGGIEPGRYDLIVLDALYRAFPEGVNENDNAAVAGLFNMIDQLTKRLGCAWVNIHHASKGEQGSKAITDVGSGGGAQSRAADAHIILRSHLEAGAFVLDAVVRSFAPVESLPLRWNYPVWQPDDTLDPLEIYGKMTKQEERRAKRDSDAISKIREALISEPATARSLRAKTGLSKDRLGRLLDQMESQGLVKRSPTLARGNQCDLYTLTFIGADVGE